jgi:hypothetical protein
LHGIDSQIQSETAVKIIADKGSTTLRNIVKCIYDADAFVLRSTAVCISEIVKHGQPLLTNVNNTCGTAPIIEYAKQTKGYLQMLGLLIIQDVCIFDDGLAKQVIEKGGINLLKEAIENEDTLYNVMWAHGVQ